MRKFCSACANEFKTSGYMCKECMFSYLAMLSLDDNDKEQLAEIIKKTNKKSIEEKRNDIIQLIRLLEHNGEVFWDKVWAYVGRSIVYNKELPKISYAHHDYVAIQYIFDKEGEKECLALLSQYLGKHTAWLKTEFFKE